MKNKFEVIILGNDINVYSVARAFYEEYGLVSNAFGQSLGGINTDSKIVNYNYAKGIDKKDVFLPVISKFCSEHKDKKVVVLGCGDNYIEVIADCKGEYPENVITHCPTLGEIKKLIRKEDFYELCEKHDIPYPGTKIISMGEHENLELSFSPPYILKPSNSVMYWEFPFEGQKKVFLLETKKELDEKIKDIYQSGYDDKLVIQEFIPGTDVNMRVLTSYSDQNGKVKMMCLGHVLLEEHSPKGIGNHAVIITEKNKELMEKYKSFLEEIGFVGFSNFDIKHDPRDNSFKAFEINVRQGRSNFYVTASGANIAKYLVEDRIRNNELDLNFVENEHLWMVVPKGVANKYVPEYKAEFKRLTKAGLKTNPMFYSKDRGLKHMLRLIKMQINYYRQYKKYGGKL